MVNFYVMNRRQSRLEDLGWSLEILDINVMDLIVSCENE